MNASRLTSLLQSAAPSSRPLMAVAEAPISATVLECTDPTPLFVADSADAAIHAYTLADAAPATASAPYNLEGFSRTLADILGVGEAEIGLNDPAMSRATQAALASLTVTDLDFADGTFFVSGLSTGGVRRDPQPDHLSPRRHRADNGRGDLPRGALADENPRAHLRDGDCRSGRRSGIHRGLYLHAAGHVAHRIAERQRACDRQAHRRAGLWQHAPRGAGIHGLRHAAQPVRLRPLRQLRASGQAHPDGGRGRGCCGTGARRARADGGGGRRRDGTDPLGGVYQAADQDTQFLLALKRNLDTGAVDLVSFRKGVCLRFSDFVPEYDLPDYQYGLNEMGPGVRGFHNLMTTDAGFPDLTE